MTMNSQEMSFKKSALGFVDVSNFCFIYLPVTFSIFPNTVYFPSPSHLPTLQPYLTSEVWLKGTSLFKFSNFPFP